MSDGAFTLLKMHISSSILCTIMRIDGNVYMHDRTLICCKSIVFYLLTFTVLLAIITRVGPLTELLRSSKTPICANCSYHNNKKEMLP